MAKDSIAITPLCISWVGSGSGIFFLQGSDPFFSNGLDPSVTVCRPGKRQGGRSGQEHHSFMESSSVNPDGSESGDFFPMSRIRIYFFFSSQCSDLHPVNNIPDLCIYLLKKKKKKKYLCYISIIHLEVLNQNEKVELSFKIKRGTGVRLVQV